MVYLIFTLSALGGLLFGYVIGVTGGALLPQTESQPAGVICPSNRTATGPAKHIDCLDLDNIQLGLLTSVNIFGALAGTVFTFIFSEAFGRRRELMAGLFMYTAGAILSALLPINYGIHLGQAIYGFGAGLSMHAAPIYISETAPSNIRGRLVSAKEAIIVLGIMTGTAIGAAFQSTVGGYQYMFGAPVVIAVPCFFILMCLPSSPRWLYRRFGDLELAKQSLGRIRLGYSQGEIEEEVRQIAESLQEEQAQLQQHYQYHDIDSGSPLLDQQKGTSVGFFEALKPKYRYSLLIGCGLVAFQQFTGQPSVLYYATSIFKSAGFGDSAALQPVLVTGFKLICTVLAVAVVDGYGRRFLLFLGIGLMTVALGILGLAFFFQTCSDPGVTVAACVDDHVRLPEPWNYITLVSLMLYVGGYQVGFGPIAWLMISEIFPLNVRGSAFSLAAITNFGSNLLVTFFFPSIMTSLGPSVAYWVYCGIAVLSIIFVHFIVPETKGLTLEEIEDKLTGRKNEAPYHV